MGDRMTNKIFKTLDEQIEILKNKGLVITDVDKAKSILFRENYFFLSGYRHLFMKRYRDSKFIEGTTFEELYSTFLFDRKLRNIMFKYILVIENNIKSIVSYQLSRKYGIRESEYLNPDNYVEDPCKERQLKDILNKMRRQIRVNSKQHSATMHYTTNYGYIPLWVVVKVLSFGIIAEFFNVLKEEDQYAIANVYNINSEVLSTYLSLLANYRNVCAHEDILYDHRTQKSIPDNKYHQFLDIEKEFGVYKYGKNDLFSLVIMMKELLSDSEFIEMLNEVSYEVKLLDEKINTVETSAILNKLGFPNNWEKIREIN